MVLGWAMLSEAIPIYPLYGLLFSDTGMSDGQIASLLVFWSLVAIVAEVPTGGLADRFSRRGALVASGVLQGAGYALWVTLPGYSGFAAGFLLWGVGGTFASGALEALVYDALTAAGACEQYALVYGRITGVGLLAQLPGAAAATVLFSSGGYAAVGWASVGCCLAGAGVAWRLPEIRPVQLARGGEGDDAMGANLGYFTVLRDGLVEAVAQPAVRAAVVAVAVLGAIDGLEEYFPLLAHGWGVPTSLVPVSTIGIPLVGAAGAAMAGRASGLRPRGLVVALGAAALAATAAGVLSRPAGLTGIALAYGLYRLVLVVSDIALQHRIVGPARATVTSAASLCTDLAAIVIYAIWVLDQPLLLGAAALAIVTGVPWLLRPDRAGPVVVRHWRGR